jgi:hypothetical protein
MGIRAVMPPARRLGPGIAAAIATAALVSCGDSDIGKESHATRTLSDKDKVEQSIADFYGAEPKAICGSLSPSALQSLGGSQRCLSAARGRKATPFNLDSVRFASGKAIAVVRSEGKVLQFTLVDENGAWKVGEPLPDFSGSAGATR